MWAMVPAVAVSVGVLGFGNHWDNRHTARHAEAALAPEIILWCVAAAVALRFFFLPSVELLPEEAYYWNYSQHLALGYLDHPPMVAWLITIGTHLLGHNPAGVRFGAVVCWLVAARFVFLTARTLFGPQAATRSLLFTALLPNFFGTGFFMTPDAPLVACWAGAVYFLVRVFFEESAGAWLGVGVCLGLGMDSKYTIALVGMGAMLFMLVDHRARRWWRHPAPYASAVLALALFSPVIFWNAKHGWASFIFQGPRRWQIPPRFSAQDLAVSVLILLTPVGAAAALILLGRQGIRETGRRVTIFARVFTLAPLAIFTCFSFRHRVELNWTAPIWLALVPSLAVAWDRVGPGRYWPQTFLALFLFYGLTLYHLALGLPGIPYSRHVELAPAGWADLASQVHGLKDRVEADTKAAPLIVGMGRYQVISELTFYDPDEGGAVSTDVGPHLFGQRSLMFEEWSTREAADGKNIILVSLDPNDLSATSVVGRFATMTSLEQGVIHYHGWAVLPFYYRIGYGYNSR